MRMLMHVKLPLEPFNSYVSYVRDGSAGEKIKSILQATKPEATYFTEYDGRRGAVMVIQIEDSSKIPFYAEPWFLQFNAEVEFHGAMTPEELGRANLDVLGKKWALSPAGVI